MVNTASCYPTDEQHERWRRVADDLDMTMSDWMACMIEAGVKAADGLDPSVGPDETEAELREQRNELRDELDSARSRISELEQRVFGSERRRAERFVADNPGCTHSELVNHLQATVPGRVPALTEGLVIDERPDGADGYYVPGDEGAEGTEGGATYVAGTGAAVRGDF